MWPLPAQSSQTSSVLDATGYVTARRQATVSSQITGRVLEVFIEEGDEVVEGQLLALLDDSLLLAQYRLAESQLSASRAALLDLHVQQKEAQLGLQRLQALADRSLISQAELDEALLKLESVEARTTVVTRQIAVAQSSVHLQSQQLAQTEIRAPFAGVVISKAAQPGEIISPVSAGGSTRTGISAIVDMTSLEIEVDVNESNINRVSSGQRVMARLNSYPDWEIPAEVITVIPAADRSRATVRVRIRFLEKDARVLPDMGVRVSFLEDKPKVDD
ncbi:MAG: efflux RND transporter periplasmic adaptor subunit [Pseudohongiella sp.]|uniref:efflux RND transporter periplasmic adaptor subunit n=1 Tax=Pseudohongiella sp. TaxID=1979412 RepID=UPI0034A06153